MTPEQKRHEEAYYAAKRRYENAYASKAKYSREKAEEETRKQQLINSINAKKSELKRVSDTYTDLAKTIGKQNEISGQVKNSARHLEAAATQFKNIGTASRGNQKDLETVFAANVTKSNKNIADAFSGIEKAKKDLSERKTTLKSEITNLNGELSTVKSNIFRYISLICDADSTMRSASVDMAYHRRYMTA